VDCWGTAATHCIPIVFPTGTLPQDPLKAPWYWAGAFVRHVPKEALAWRRLRCAHAFHARGCLHVALVREFIYGGACYGSPSCLKDAASCLHLGFHRSQRQMTCI